MKYLCIPLFFIGCYSGYSQTFFDSVVDKDWAGEGTLMGSEATFTLNWRKVLIDQFYQLQFSNETQAYRFEATGYYQVIGEDSISGTWFDIRGYTFPLKGNVTNSQLTINWGTPETELGQTVYTLQEDGRILAVDYVQRNGELIQFGNAVYHQ